MRIDKCGLEGLPLQLMITLVILGISLPVIFATWTNVDASSTEGRLGSEVERLAAQVEQAYSFGPGTGLKVRRVDLSSGTFAMVEYIEMGDTPRASTSAVIRYRIQGQSERFVIIPREVPLTSSGNTTFTVGPGVYDFLLETVRSDAGDVYVVISRAS